MALERAYTLARIRTLPDVDVAVVDDDLWVRTTDESNLDALACLPAERRYLWNSDGQLVPFGQTLPVDRFQDSMQWTELDEWIEVDAPPSSYCGEFDVEPKLNLVRDEQVTDPNLMITGYTPWLDWCVHAPMMRLAPLRFAMSDEQDVMVHGRPLPPIPGRFFHLTDCIALPLAYRFDFPFDPTDIAELIDLRPDEIAVFELDGMWHRVGRNEFVDTTRAAVRASRPEENTADDPDVDESDVGESDVDESD